MWTQERALISAASQGATWLVIRLLDEGADANASTRLGLSPLHAAAYMGHADAVRTLLERGAAPEPNGAFGISVDTVMGHQFWTPFEGAAARGHIDCLELLVAKGVAINGHRFVGRRALHRAACRTDPSVLAWLLEHGADPERREYGAPFSAASRTPAMYAAAAGNIPGLQMLATADARLDATVWTIRGRYRVTDYAKTPEVREFLARHVV